MAGKLYKVKDMVELFGITRDTIKYYEKKGLIELKRDDSGYRVFDEFNIEKMKKILDLRNLGFSVKEVMEMLELREPEDNEILLAELRKETEGQIRELNQKLEKIRLFEKDFFERRRFKRGFNVEYNAVFCRECPYITDLDKCSFYVRRSDVFLTNENGSIIKKKEEYIVFCDESLKEECRSCGAYKKRYSYIYRGIFLDEGEEQLQKLFQEAYASALQMGYKLQHTIYVNKLVLTKEDGEGLFLDIRIPMKDIN